MRVLSTLGMLTLVAALQAQGPVKLAPGMAAPKLEVGGWAKYDAPVAKAGRLRVVEFWATWCGPCKTSIPHLTELAKKYRDKVDFVGVSVWENGADTVGQVKKFVAEWGDKMDYRVAYDTPTNAMSEKWMRAAEQPGIPSAFIIDDKNTVLWVGHPMSIDEPLERALTGKLDVKAEKVRFLKEVEDRRAQSKIRTDIAAASTLHRNGKKAEAEKALDEIGAKSKQAADAVRLSRFMSIYKAGTPESNSLLEKFFNEPGGKSIVAQFVMQNSRPDADDESKAVARKVADRILADGKDAIALYYVGVAYSYQKDKEAAMKAFDAASAAAANDEHMKSNTSFLDAIKNQKENLAKQG